MPLVVPGCVAPVLTGLGGSPLVSRALRVAPLANRLLHDTGIDAAR